MIRGLHLLIVQVVLMVWTASFLVNGGLIMADEPDITGGPAAAEDASVPDVLVGKDVAEITDQAAAFHKHVLPLLRTKCISCHGPEKQEGGLRLDSREAAMKGGAQGPAIVPMDSDGSLFLRAIEFADPELQMPPKQKLSETEISILTQWIQDGAVWPDGAANPESHGEIGDAFHDERNPVRQLFGEERLTLWSLKRPGIARPDGLSEEELQDPSRVIDGFLSQKLRSLNLTMSSPADRRTLIRRTTFDLTGLPPTPEDVAAFENDSAPHALERVVDRLLNSASYGERQARLWLDVVRYADTHGYERDEFRPLAWKYRDYVVRSFNSDKPYDRFVREQLAGDELVDGAPQSAEDADALIATGFLRLGQWDSTASIFQEEDRLRAEQMADLTNTTGSAFLGMTMSCCQCHDHKYDPLTQADHFRLRAFFAAVTPRDDLSVSLAQEQAEIDRHNESIDQQIAGIRKQLEPITDDSEATKGQRASLERQIQELEATRRSPEVIMGAVDSGGEAPATHILYQGDYASPREDVVPGYVTVLYPGPAQIEKLREGTTGRRTALANWIVSDTNPWTARVIVNRIWAQHFSTGIVATPNDFGFSGARPTHPELLDWLANEFVQQGWSIKKLHRWIVLSDAYQQSSVAETIPEVDPENTLLWRQNLRRLDAEALRDSLLAVSGLLQPLQGGRPLWPEVPEELTHAQPAILEAIKDGDGGRMQGWYTDPPEKTHVRSLYLIRKRCLPIPFLQSFDLPDSTVSCARRDTTVVAPQALMLLNSPEGILYAEALADRVLSDAQKHPLPNTDPEQSAIERLFQLTLNRPPTAEERLLADEHLQDGRRNFAEVDAASRSRMAFVSLCRAMLNLNEFVYVD
jgi:mono/diheme cytochrome c family protein